MKFPLSFAIFLAEGLAFFLKPQYNDLSILISRRKNGVFVEAIIKSEDQLNPHERVKYYLFTRQEQLGREIHINGTLRSTEYDFSSTTKFLIHGFANSVSSEFNTLLIKAYLKKGGHNVIVVDWSALGTPPFYPTAVHNAKLVGWQVSLLLRWLVSQGVSLGDVHMLGYSVGAHIAGVAAHHIKDLGQVVRITGLDPAKPMFELEGEEHRLTSDDAGFVDCIHTCGAYLGLSDPSCSADFYPNGGTNPQPGCIFDIFGKCSHQRAYQYFAESVLSPHSFVAVQCSVIEDYSPANCSTQTAGVMGEHTSTRLYGIFYLTTAANSPFSLRNTDEKISPVSYLTQFSWYFH